MAFIMRSSGGQFECSDGRVRGVSAAGTINPHTTVGALKLSGGILDSQMAIDIIYVTGTPKATVSTS